MKIVCPVLAERGGCKLQKTGIVAFSSTEGTNGRVYLQLLLFRCPIVYIFKFASYWLLGFYELMYKDVCCFNESKCS